MPVTNSRVSVNPSASRGTLASSVAVAKHPGCDTCGVGDLRQMLRHGAGELANPRRRAVRVLVHRLVGAGSGIAKVRRDVDAVRARAGRLGRR